VVFALTKRDQKPAGWTDILGRNRALVSQHAERFRHAPIVAVSPLLEDQLQAADAPVPPDARATLTGIEDLRRILHDQIASSRSTLALRNALRHTWALLGGVEQQLAERAAAARQDSGVSERAEAERVQLEELQEHSERWLYDLERDVANVRTETVERLETACADLLRIWTQQIDGLQGSILDDDRAVEGLALQVHEELATIHLDLLEDHANRLVEAIGDLLRRMGLEVAVAVREPSTPSGTAAAPPPGAGVPAQAQIGLVFQSVMVGKLGMAVVAGAAGMAAWPLAVALGYPAYAILKTRSSRDRRRSELTMWLRNEVIPTAKRRVTGDVDALLREQKPELITAVKRQIKERARDLNEVLGEAKRAAQTDRNQRHARAVGLEAHRRTVLAQRGTIEATLAELGDAADEVVQDAAT
jgi:hypothetical protein